MLHSGAAKCDRVRDGEHTVNKYRHLIGESEVRNQIGDLNVGDKTVLTFVFM
jgi:hypothetical protein